MTWADILSRLWVWWEGVVKWLAEIVGSNAFAATAIVVVALLFIAYMFRERL